MSDRLPIDEESEDIFASTPYERDDEPADCEDESVASEDEAEDDAESDRKAAAALTSLVSGSRGESGAALGADGSREFKIPLRFTKSGRKRAVPFPMKLMKVLTEEKNSEIISWMPSGKAFAIRKPKLFVAQILGGIFKTAKYSSFTRKLHRWGFMRHYRGAEAGSFYHELFQKDRPDLCEKMTCYTPLPPAKAPAVIKKLKAAAPLALPPNELKQTPTIPQPMIAVRQSLTPRTSMTGSMAVPPPQQAPMQIPRPLQAFELPVPPQLLPSAAAVDLNAAIELEVSRRLKERINQAALSRQALLIMQQREQEARQEQQLRYQLAVLQQQQQQQQQIQQQELGLAPSATAGLVRHLAALKFGNSTYKPNTTANFQHAFGSTAMGLPPTNIQGAKTA